MKVRMIKKPIVAIIIILTLLLNVALVSAHFLGGKWSANISYYTSSSDSCYSSIIQAVSNWNSVSKRTFYASTLTSAVVSADSYAYGTTGWDGLTTLGPNLRSGTYTYGSIRLNRAYVDEYMTVRKTAIASHEFGHALGLDHTGTTAYQSIMYNSASDAYINWGINAPVTHDINDIKSLYP